MSAAITINGNKTGLAAQSGPLLFALARQNIHLPTACGGRGLCGSCKIKVLSGAGPVNEIEKKKLKPEEIGDGMRLSCQVPVADGLSVLIPEHLLSARRYRSVVAGKKTWTCDIAGLSIQLIEPDTISFVPGRYIQVECPAREGKESVTRAYSIASPPQDKKRIELMVRKVPNGACSVWIFDHVKEGDEIMLTGPFGEFGLSDARLPALFIAGGSGMAPFWSIIRHMQKTKATRPVTFFFGARTQRDLFLVDEMRALQQQSDWFTFVPALSSEPADSGWSGERGLITDVVARHFPDTSGHEAYLCGAPGMIDASIKALTRGGMPLDRIYYDTFA
jgi:Na+-transporting NADH:ubiquinone oxidoreductase subunit F